MASEKQQTLYSLVLELQATTNAFLPQTTGHLVHAMFLNFVKQFDPALSSHLHDMPGPRPFTLSALTGGTLQGNTIVVKHGEYTTLRLTLLDGGTLWQGLTTHLLETVPVNVQIGKAIFRLVRVLSSPAKDTTGRVNMIDWHTLVSLPVSSEIGCHFVSPTAFSLGQRTFSLIPHPTLLWESLLRSWNVYAPMEYHLDRLDLTEALRQIRVVSCDLRVEALHYAHAPQKGFVGTCRYALLASHQFASFLTTLVRFAYYAGVGYKTTMGMGQMTTLLTHPGEKA